MSAQQRKSNWQKLYAVGRYHGQSVGNGILIEAQYVSKYTAEAWGVAFVSDRGSTLLIGTCAHG